MAPARSPLAPERFADLPPVAGVSLATAATGIRYAGRDDLLVAVMEPGTTAAGVLTRSATAAAPVLWCREALAGGRARALVVNAGNANAFTGRAGEDLVRETVGATARLAAADAEEVYVASTGVIGEPLPPDAIARHLDATVRILGTADWQAAARAIMTTDTFEKGAGVIATADGHPITVVGIAKGSGMIQPDMATMLAFVFTDAAVAAPVLQDLVRDIAERTFNSITVDGDTSTSDTCLVFATGKAGNTPITGPDDPGHADLAGALETVMRDLAIQIVRDGEGAQKLVTLTVTGGDSHDAAKRVALSIANSQLVKTAIAGEDANWGRIVMAIGKAGARVERDRLTISIGGVLVAADGMRVPDYDEAPVAAHMRGRDIRIDVDLGLGAGEATVWACDLTHGYIDINGSYRS